MEYLRDCDRSRLAVIANPEKPPSHIAQCRQLANDCGVTMLPEWELSVNLRFHAEHWVRNMIRLLFKQPAGQRPVGLIIGNENLFEYVLNALQYENVEPGCDLVIAVHTNFPTNRPKPCQVKRIGFEVRDIIECCIESLEKAVRAIFRSC